MKYSNNFLEIVKNPENKLFRNIDLEEKIENVIMNEGKNYYESTEIMTFLRYYFKLISSKEFEYKIVYYYDNNRLIDIISLTIEFDIGLRNNITIDEFDDLVKEFNHFLENKYGKPEIKSKNVKGNGKEVYNTWIDITVADKPIQIVQIFYANKKEGIEKAMKLEFQYYYE